MKIKSLFVVVLLMAGPFIVPQASANEKPVVESFTFTPQEIELTGSSTIVSFELTVSHPFGIENTFTEVVLKNGIRGNYSAILRRTDQPVNLSLKKVIFKGSIEIPRDVVNGVYSVTATSLINNSAAGYSYGTGLIESSKIRNLKGAESGLLIRNFGDLNLDFQPFQGPAYDTTLSVAYENPILYSSSNLPIWKVGETYNPLKYYELLVTDLPLKISTSTPTVCTSDGKSMSFIKEGDCSFKVFTDKNNDYPGRISSQNATISPARTKIFLDIEKVADQTDIGLPKTIQLNQVYSASSGWVVPKSETPTTCLAGGYFIKLITPGNCKLSYQTPETAIYKASDIYIQSFEILKDGKPFVPTPVATPTPTATPTAKPVVKKTISCVKGTKTIKKTAISPKCPAGYKVKK
jgi:hypothetical protein